MPSIRLIDTSSTTHVGSKIGASSYHVHFDAPNEHDKDVEHNGSIHEPIPRLHMHHHTPANEVDHTSGPSQGKTNIFAPLTRSSNELPAGQMIDLRVLWSNIVPTLQKDRGEQSTATAQPTSHILAAQSGDVPKFHTCPLDTTFQPKAAAEQQWAAQPPWLPKGQQPSTHMEDYAWPLEYSLQDIQDDLRKNTTSMFSFPPSSPLQNQPTNLESTRSPGEVHKPTTKSMFMPQQNALPHKYTAPSLPPKSDGYNHRNLEKHTSNPFGGNSMIPITSTPPPTLTDSIVKPTYRRSSSIHSTDKTIFIRPSPPVSEISDDYFQDTTSTPATTPPTSPVITDTGSGHPWSEEIAWKNEDIMACQKVAAALFDDDDEDSLFGDEVQETTDVQRLDFSEPEPAKEPSTDVHPKPATRIITKRPIRELRALMPKQASRKTKVYRKREGKSQQGRVPATVGPSVSQSHPIPTHISEQAFQGRGVKRPASSRNPPARPAKRQATQANVPKHIPESTLIEWTNKLRTFEEIVYTGISGPGEVQRLLGLLNSMVAVRECMPPKWVLETMRTRDVNGVEDRKNKPSLLRAVAKGYKNFEGGEEVKVKVKELLDSWMVVAKTGEVKLPHIAQCTLSDVATT
ncbi:hypothetical protein B0H10DRAFT_1995167 [Mycena sp. CBHHK59/15]|nr:hypothetical protein B0H10DRAFT_1995167 [Mycena sp. CBHHK59/15]